MSQSMTHASAAQRAEHTVARSAGYSPGFRVLHWATAACVLTLFVSGIVMTQLGGGGLADWLYSSHKLLGAGALFLLCLRVAYKLGARALGSRKAGGSGHPAHFFLYAAGIAVPLLGWAGVSDYGARETLFGLTLPPLWREGAGHYPWLFTAHAWLAFGLIGLVAIHIGVALHNSVTRGQSGKL